MLILCVHTLQGVGVGDGGMEVFFMICTLDKGGAAWAFLYSNNGRNKKASTL